jgi:hypothetical protein
MYTNKDGKMYEAEISRSKPSLFLFLLDQSYSMSEAFGGKKGNATKKDGAADAINHLLYEIVLRCSKGMEVRNYFDIGVIGYGCEKDWVGPAFEGILQGRSLVTATDLADNPTRIEKRQKTQPDSAGSVVEVEIDFPVWFSPVAGHNTPMCKAFEYAYGILESWCIKHPESFPPIVIHITDGQATDGDPADPAEKIKTLRTDDGNILLFNCHLSSKRNFPVVFPDSTDDLADEFAERLFGMSSTLPKILQNEAANEGYDVSDDTRGFVFNAELTDLIQFLDIGTRTTGIARDV